MKNKLKVFKGDSLKIIPKICEDLKINFVFWNRCYEKIEFLKILNLKNIC